MYKDIYLEKSFFFELIGILTFLARKNTKEFSNILFTLTNIDFHILRPLVQGFLQLMTAGPATVTMKLSLPQQA